METPSRLLGYSAPTLWALERIVEKSSDNPANGAKAAAQPKTFPAPFFETTNAVANTGADQESEENPNQYAAFFHS